MHEIAFPEDEEEEEEDDEQLGASTTTVSYDALVPGYGWVAVEQGSSSSLCWLLHDPRRTPLPAPPRHQRTPLHTRSLHPTLLQVKPGQGVLVRDSSSLWTRGIVRTTTASSVLLVDSGREIDIGQVVRPLFSPPLTIVRGDGNCLFRAVSHQVYGTEQHHQLVRQTCARFIELEQAYFEPFIKGPFADYVARMKTDAAWGGDAEIEAAADIYQCKIEVFDSGTWKLRKQCGGKQGVAVIRLLFHDSGHYDSIESPLPSPARQVVVVGQMEQRAIGLCETRRAGGVHLGVRESDVLASETAQLQECETLTALQESEASTLEQDLLQKAMQDSLDDLWLEQALQDSLYM